MSKEKLVRFDIEEARKDPSRIRWTGGDLPWHIHIFPNGHVIAQWDEYGKPMLYNPTDSGLRLAVKTKTVKVYVYTWQGETNPCSTAGMGVISRAEFERVPEKNRQYWKEQGPFEIEVEDN